MLAKAGKGRRGRSPGRFQEGYLSGRPVDLYGRQGDGTLRTSRLIVLSMIFVSVLAGCARTGKKDFNRGLELYEKGRYEKSVRHLEKAVDIAPDDPEAWHALGVAYTAASQLEEALEAHRRAVKNEPSQPRWWTGLGIALRNGGQMKEARESFEAALELDSEFAAAHYYLGLLEQEQGNDKKAGKAFRRALKANPGCIEAREALERLESR